MAKKTKDLKRPSLEARKAHNTARVADAQKHGVVVAVRLSVDVAAALAKAANAKKCTMSDHLRALFLASLE